jgi:FixJ family two-component response regulator
MEPRDGELEPATVFLVDRDEATATQFHHLAESMGVRLQTCFTGDELLTELPDGAVGCVVTELRVRGVDGPSILSTLRERQPDLPVMFLTASGTIRDAVWAIQNGAFAFFEKPASEQALWEPVARAISLHRERIARLRPLQRLRLQLSQLTAAEREVLDFVLQGNTNRQIAEMLKLSVRTIELRRSGMMAKVGVDTLPALFKFVFSAGYEDGRQVDER